MCYEREKQRAQGKQEGAAVEPQREEKAEKGEERPLEAHLAQGPGPSLTIKHLHNM